MWIIIGALAAFVLALLAAAAKIDRRHEAWREMHNPPDREEKFDDDAGVSR